ncbi:FIP (Fungus-Induced Protein) Related [Caenorhabditis elegans]|uniref:FIP (Fungus-Induced Protein) Related n=1 Tax=Caenorhabditis elegans TaxID=6239 RepID=N1NV15_CAEEL|nr:FIP (Fungus-Induced Protein) Related [Caenorhabditis elegans]CCW45988.1 FIP (Fungus-Induced Protein) Related [Caenorhabditis elegans]|eukprot:NP_001294079.1 Uncharacterized protein CELE_F13E9.9 [Caenorhabditis elegans]
MRIVFILALLIVGVIADSDSFDEIKSRIKELVDNGKGKNEDKGKKISFKRKTSKFDYDNDEGDLRQGGAYFVNNEDDNDESYYNFKNSPKNKRDETRENDFNEDNDEDSMERRERDSATRSRFRDSNEDTDSFDGSVKNDDNEKPQSSESNENSDVSSKSRSDSDYYKNGKKKGFLGKLIGKVTDKLKTIPRKFAAGAALLTGKVVSGAASIPEKVVDGVKSIPGKAKSILPGGKKKNGDITLNDYTQENHLHVHRDRHYHDERHAHQDDSQQFSVYNDWDGFGSNRRNYPVIYDGFRSKRSVEFKKPGQLHKKESIGFMF